MSAGLAVGVVLVSLMLPRRYTATAAFMPQNSGASLGQYAGLAAQLGIGGLGAGIGTTPEFYADLIRSGPLLRAVVQHEYRYLDGGDSAAGTLVDLYDIEKPTEPWRVASAVKVLRKHLNVRTDPKTAVVKLAVEAEAPELAKQVMEVVLGEVNRFNLQTRQSQAGQERQFIEARLSEASAELRGSEGRLTEFLTRNREYRNSPQLAFEHDRLEREVNMRQEVYNSLMQSYDRARIEEVRNTPVITVVEAPIAPPVPDRRYLLLKAVIAAIVGLMVGGLLAIVSALVMESEEREPRETAEFRDLWIATTKDLRAPWNFFIPARLVRGRQSGKQG